MPNYRVRWADRPGQAPAHEQRDCVSWEEAEALFEQIRERIARSPKRGSWVTLCACPVVVRLYPPQGAER